MPYFVVSEKSPFLGFVPEGFNCKRSAYKKLKSIPSFDVTGEFIAYASPDSTYAVTKRLFDLAKKEIIIGIYDFTAGYVKELLLNAMERKVKVTLMLDINLPAEEQLFMELAKFGCKTVPAPSCQNKVARYFPNCHEKFVIIDNEWLLVQSGNYSKNSIPFNQEDGGDAQHFKKGNRDMGIALRSKELAVYFKQVLLSDIKLVEDATSPEALRTEVLELPLLVDFVPQKLPDKLFPSKTLVPAKPIKVKPVFSPDNYMAEVTKMLASAKKSIYIENQYIRATQTEVAKLLTAMAEAKKNNPGLDIRIVLGKVFSVADIPKEEGNLKVLKDTYGLDLGTNIRYIDIDRFVHCHNKLIVVDGQKVLISSQNWSDTAVSQNREAGLLLENSELAEYYTSIFESDWETAWSKIAFSTGDAKITPESLVSGNYTEVSLGDYEEV
jgi:phosphatidylserine/phosphatidylglycerophosphate/cardiolipin synthase-like enzyme